MTAALFFADNDQFFSTSAMRARVKKAVAAAPLIRRAAGGDRRAVEALHAGFWPFVEEFERAIDRHQLPRQPLQRRFRDAPDGARVNDVLRTLARHVLHMKNEEGSHAQVWRKHMRDLGSDRLAGASPLGGVARLIALANDDDLPRFFALLAATELIAEELSACLVGHADFVSLFPRGRWTWGDIHLASHHGPSHLQIDLDLARAYSSDDAVAAARVEDTLAQVLAAFRDAADEVEANLAAPVAI